MRVKPPVWFWIVSVIALLWNMLGVMAFVGQMMLTQDMLAQLPEAQRVALETRPMWATIAFAVAVFAGAIGSALLLLRSALAKHVLIASLLGVIVQFTQAFMSSSMADIGSVGLVMMLLVFVISGLLVWLATYAGKRGWLR
ncbi:MAG: hypothetical protein R3F22_05635 [Lysobacteraceae bacterium]